MNKKKVAINTGLAVILVAASVEGVRAIGNPEQPKPVAQTATVAVGDVATTVTATGNLNAPITVGLPFRATQPGVVTAVDVKVGQDVEPGQVLATIDDRAAHNQLELAKVAVQAGEAQLATAMNTPTSSQRFFDNASVAASTRELKTALLNEHQAKIKYSLDRSAQDALVSVARRAVYANRNDLTFSRQRSVSNSNNSTTTVTTTTPPGTVGPSVNTAGPSSVSTNSRTATASSTRSQIALARSNLVAAEAQRASVLLADVQEVESQHAAAILAKHNLDVAVATGQVNERGAHTGPIDQAKAAIAQANVQVRQAQEALDDTVLKSTFKGKVVYVAGSVGETPIAAPRGTVPGSATPNGPGAVENRLTASVAGFVILADETDKVVTAQVDEADIGKVKLGQTALVSFPATGTVLPGTVSSIDEQETVINNVVEYNVNIDLDSHAAVQKLGQSASVVITTASAKNVMTVPNNAIINAGQANIVAVQRGKELVKVPVTVGLVGDTTTEVSSPMLKPGDVVVLPMGGGGNRLKIPSRSNGTKGAL